MKIDPNYLEKRTLSELLQLEWSYEHFAPLPEALNIELENLREEIKSRMSKEDYYLYKLGVLSDSSNTENT